MAVPLPDEHSVNLVPPDLDEIHLMIRGVATTGAAPGGLTEVQRTVVNATVEAMSGHVVDVTGMDPLGPDDFGSTVECEIEVFGFVETGYLFSAPKGFFEYDRGHSSRDAEHMAVRLADAMARGARAAWWLNDHARHSDVDFLGIDWFEYADWPVNQVRRSFGAAPKSEKAIDCGSVTAWEPGGISPFQNAHGREVAEAEGLEYDSDGATPVAG